MNSSQAARIFYGRLLKDIPFSASWNLLSVIIQFERSQNDMDAKRVTHLYEKAVDLDGTTSPDVWLNYMQFEESIGNVDKMGYVQREIIWGTQAVT